MNEIGLIRALAGLPLGGLRYLPVTGSTNDDALAWAAQNAPDSSLIIADEQTTGRGRANRSWFTPPGAALAFSLILRPGPKELNLVGRFSGLGAIALVNSLSQFGLHAQIKWPNDVLINGKKVAGILVESVWMGAKMESVILGMGVNVTPEALPPAEGLNFPATCLAAEGLSGLARPALLKTLLQELISLRATLASDSFLRRWDALLAFRGQPVRVWREGTEEITGYINGLGGDGSLRLRLDPSGEERSLHAGEIHLRPLAP